MSKRSKRTKRKPRPSSRKPQPAVVREVSWWRGSSPTEEGEERWRRIFLGVAGVVLVLMLGLSLNSGINADDEFQNDYSEKLVDYYLSFGADTAALNIPKGKMHLYGGLFDLVAGLTNRALGFGMYDEAYHDVRHLFNALFGFLAMLFTALFVRRVAGWRGALLALIFLFLSPRFLGHSLMNPKDIPFAAGYIVALYFMMEFIRRLPNPGWKTTLGLVAGIGMAIGTRAGGLLLIAYLGLFVALDFLMRYGVRGLVSKRPTLLRTLGWSVGAAVGGFVLALLFWPYALVSPIAHTMEALNEFSSLGVKIRVLFMGQNIMSDATPWHYPLTWMAITIPLFVSVAFLGGLVMVRGLVRRFGGLAVSLSFFAAVFPVAYIIAKDAILHDGWRHLTFVYPPMVVGAVLFWLWAEERLRSNRFGLRALHLILVLTLLEPALFIARNPAYPYVYFNMASGGISHAFGRFETDYWGLSVKQAVRWMERQGILREDMPDTLVVSTSFIHNLRVYTKEKYQGKVKPIYRRFNQRYETPWDYAVYPSRYIRGGHLRNRTWPNSKSIHAVRANGVPLTAIEQAKDDYAFRGEAAFKAKDFAGAVEWLKKEVEAYPDNEAAWEKLAMAYANLGQALECLHAAEKLLEVAPDNVNGLFYRGFARLNLGQADQALSDFRRATEVNSDYGTAWYYMALIQSQRQDYAQATKNALTAIEKMPKLRPAYELAIQLLEAQGDRQRADQVRALLARIQ